MGTDIFEFWSQIKPSETVHPDDRDVLSRVRNGFDLSCLPACFMGPLRSAPVVLLYLSPGLSKQDYVDAKSKRGRQRYVSQRGGRALLPDMNEHTKAWRWWSSRCKHFGSNELLRGKVAVLNIGAYHSKSFHDWGLLAALPSSRISIQWAQNVLFPQATAGKRVVVCLRAARFWGLQEGKKYGRALFVPFVTRGGHMKKGKLRDEVIQAVRRKMAL